MHTWKEVSSKRDKEIGASRGAREEVFDPWSLKICSPQGCHLLSGRELPGQFYFEISRWHTVPTISRNPFEPRDWNPSLEVLKLYRSMSDDKNLLWFIPMRLKSSLYLVSFVKDPVFRFYIVEGLVISQWSQKASFTWWKCSWPKCIKMLQYLVIQSLEV